MQSRLPTLAVRVIMLGGALVFLVLAADRAYGLRGHATWAYVPGKVSSVLSSLFPSDRVGPLLEENGRAYVTPKRDILYFTAAPGRDYQKITVSMILKDNAVPFIELGVARSQETWSYDRYPLYARAIEQLEWNTKAEDTTFLYEPQNRFPDIESAKQAVNRGDAVMGTYFYDGFLRSFRLPDYHASSTEHQLSQAIRGAHELITYIKDESLSFTFSAHDLNRAAGADPVTIRVIREETGVTVQTFSLADDGVIDASRTEKDDRDIPVTIANLPEGAYRLSLGASDDIVFSKTQTFQQKIVFKDHLFLATSDEYFSSLPAGLSGSARITTNAPRLSAKVFHDAALQTVQADTAFVSITKKDTATLLVDSSEKNIERTIRTSRNNIALTSVGATAFFALNTDQWFVPVPKQVQKLDPLTPPGSLSLDAIATTANPAKKLPDGWLEVSTTIPLTGIARSPEGTYQFLLSLPLMENSPGSVKIATITTTFEGAALSWNKVTQKINALLKK